jgi:YggT family protein
MFIFGHFLNAIAVVLDFALVIYMWIVIARAVLSWVSPDPYNPIVRFINNVTDPVMYYIRRNLPVVYGGIDLSPILVLLAIVFLRTFLVATLFSMARTLM